jgi:hypothetical protein
MLAGCSKHARKFADLGVVEVTDGGTNRVTISDGKVFVIRSFILNNQKGTVNGKEVVIKGPTIAFIIAQEQTNSLGGAYLTQERKILTEPGVKRLLRVGATPITITLNIKP